MCNQGHLYNERVSIEMSKMTTSPHGVNLKPRFNTVANQRSGDPQKSSTLEKTSNAITLATS